MNKIRICFLFLAILCPNNSTGVKLPPLVNAILQTAQSSLRGNPAFARIGKLTNEELLLVASNENEPYDDRIAALERLKNMSKAENTEALKRIYQQTKDSYINQWNQESLSPYLSNPYTDKLYLFSMSCQALGATGNQEAISFLREECKAEHWDYHFTYKSPENLQPEVITDSCFRLYVFKGLLTAAEKHKWLMKEIKRYSDRHLRGTKENVHSWIKEYETEHPGPAQKYIVWIIMSPMVAFLIFVFHTGVFRYPRESNS